jgi:hypothetical protein
LTVDYLPLLLPLLAGEPRPSCGVTGAPEAPPRVPAPRDEEPPPDTEPPAAEPKAVAAVVALVRLFFTIGVEVVAVREYVAMNGALVE